MTHIEIVRKEKDINFEVGDFFTDKGYLYQIIKSNPSNSFLIINISMSILVNYECASISVNTIMKDNYPHANKVKTLKLSIE